MWVLCNSLGRASEVWLWRQVVGFRRFTPTVIAGGHDNPEVYPVDDIPVQILPSVHARTSRLGRAMDRGMNARLGWYRGRPREARWLADRLGRDRPQVILAHYASTAMSILPIARHFRVPVVAHGHGIDMSGWLRMKWYQNRLIASLPHLAAFVVVADYQAVWLREQGLAEERVHVIPCGVPVTEFIPAVDVGTEPCRFVAIGRFTEKKRPDLTIRAFARCADQCPSALLRMVGDGDLKPQCEALAEELGVADRVAFLGVQPNEVVRRELREASVFVQHSVTAETGDKEGWPVAVAEAAATGLPIIATRHAGIPSQVHDGRTGFLVDEGNWQEMAGRMIELARDPMRREAMGKAGRELMACEFDVRDQIAKLEDVLLKVARASTT